MEGLDDDAVDLRATYDGEESEKLVHMESALHNRIIGQHEAIEAISKAVRRSRAPRCRATPNRRARSRAAFPRASRIRSTTHHRTDAAHEPLAVAGHSTGGLPRRQRARGRAPRAAGRSFSGLSFAWPGSGLGTPSNSSAPAPRSAA